MNDTAPPEQSLADAERLAWTALKMARETLASAAHDHASQREAHEEASEVIEAAEHAAKAFPDLHKHLYREWMRMVGNDDPCEDDPEYEWQTIPEVVEARRQRAALERDALSAPQAQVNRFFRDKAVNQAAPAVPWDTSPPRDPVADPRLEDARKKIRWGYWKVGEAAKVNDASGVRRIQRWVHDKMPVGVDVSAWLRGFDRHVEETLKSLPGGAYAMRYRRPTHQL